MEFKTAHFKNDPVSKRHIVPKLAQIKKGTLLFYYLKIIGIFNPHLDYKIRDLFFYFIRMLLITLISVIPIERDGVLKFVSYGNSSTFINLQDWCIPM